ncbi:hypothetical protein TIFTF001_034769 [Ficus carica]|uniref:Uncharacterized protein n=1 Tax=Ficus carica TaxID=3494 RepID=A0AA88JAY8_FICCA|nr:hypothetical protein TIFTF001_034769 [Ficus carica]
MSSRELENLIRDKGGYALKLIIDKKLYKTDVDEGQYRLSMPLERISFSDDFLNRSEKMIMNRSTKKHGLKEWPQEC